MASRPVLERFEVQRRAQEEATPDRVARAIALRRALSPQDLLNEDGSIDQSFFRPKSVVVVEDKKWGPAEQDALLTGLATHGVGAWRAMRDALLPRWDETALRVKAARALGSQSLARYAGWTGGRDAVDAEFAANRAVGAATGCWKNGVLVEDDAGSVAAHLAAAHRGGE